MNKISTTDLFKFWVDWNTFAASGAVVRNQLLWRYRSARSAALASLSAVKNTGDGLAVMRIAKILRKNALQMFSSKILHLSQPY